jgi:hypothetical protein
MIHVNGTNAFDQLGSCPVLAELLQTRRVVGRSGKVFEGLGALSTCNNLFTLHRLMQETKAARTLEVGLSFGGSALLFTWSHRELGREPKGQHVALDPFQESVWDSTGLAVLERAGLSGYLDYRPAFSSRELPKMLASGEHFDLVYIDGSHLFEDVFVDAYFIIRLLADGGVVAFDDSSNPHVAKVLRFLRTSLSDRLPELDLGRHRQSKLGGLRYRFARWLGRIQLTAFRRVGDVERNWDAPFRTF